MDFEDRKTKPDRPENLVVGQLKRTQKRSSPGSKGRSWGDSRCSYSRRCESREYAKYTKKEGHPRPGGRAPKTISFCEAVTSWRSESVRWRQVPRASTTSCFGVLGARYVQFHTKIRFRYIDRTKLVPPAVFDGQLTGVAFIALVDHRREDESTAIRSLDGIPGRTSSWNSREKV